MSTFKQIYNTLLEAHQTEQQKIASAIAKLKLEYGEQAATVIDRLLAEVDKHAKLLNEFRKTDAGKTPKLKLLDKPKRGMSQEAMEEENARRTEQFTQDMKRFNADINRLYQNKIDGLYPIYKEIEEFRIPDESCELTYVFGNYKVGKDTLIINMGPATVCDAAASGQCDLYCGGCCYAQNNETTHKLAIVKRFREKLQWKGMSAETLATQLAGAVTSKRKTQEVKYIRFNESGDFENPDDIAKLMKVVKQTNDILAKEGGKVQFYTYTHRSDLFAGYANKNPDLVIQGSGTLKSNNKVPFFVDNCFIGIPYDDAVNMVENGKLINTPEKRQELADMLQLDVAELPKTIVFCRGECFGCNYCKDKATKRLILIAYHGTGSKIAIVNRGAMDKLRKLMKTTITSVEQIPANVKGTIYTDLLKSNYYNENSVIDRLVTLCMQKKGSKGPVLDPLVLYPFYMELKAMTSADPNVKRVMTPLINPKTGKFLKSDEVQSYFADKVAKLQAYNQKIQQNQPAKLDVPVADDEEEEVAEGEISESLIESFKKNGIPLTEGASSLQTADLSNVNPSTIANLAMCGLLKTIKNFVPESEILKSAPSEVQPEAPTPAVAEPVAEPPTQAPVAENVFYKLFKDID